MAGNVLINERAEHFELFYNKNLKSVWIGCLFMDFSQEGSLAQDGSKAIRVLGGVGSGDPFREDQRGVVEVR